MKMLIVKIGLSFLFPLLCLKNQNMNQKVEEYLIAVYPQKKELQEGEFQYIRSSKISRLPANEIKKCYPGWEFYRTHLQTAYFEFPEVEVLIAIEAKNPNRIYLLKSLSFEPPDPVFLTLFYGCVRKSENEQHQLAHAITALMASVAVQPEIEELSSNNDSEVSYRINQANGSYVDFKYRFNDNGVLDHIFCSGN
jgi:hypothetical protein